MERWGLIALCALALGCGMTERQFDQQSKKALCDWAVECFDAYESQDECMDDLGTSLGAEGCTYDSSAARECVKGLRALTCADTADDFPSACGDVYTCGDTDDT